MILMSTLNRLSIIVNGANASLRYKALLSVEEAKA